MNTIMHYFTLDLDRQDTQVYVSARKDDTAIALCCNLMGSGNHYEITASTTAKLAAILPDGTYKEAACAISDNHIEVTLSSEITAQAGHVYAYFKLKDGAMLLSSPRFTIDVDDPNN